MHRSMYIMPKSHIHLTDLGCNTHRCEGNRRTSLSNIRGRHGNASGPVQHQQVQHAHLLPRGRGRASNGSLLLRAGRTPVLELSGLRLRSIRLRGRDSAFLVGDGVPGARSVVHWCSTLAKRGRRSDDGCLTHLFELVVVDLLHHALDPLELSELGRLKVILPRDRFADGRRRRPRARRLAAFNGSRRWTLFRDFRAVRVLHFNRQRRAHLLRPAGIGSRSSNFPRSPAKALPHTSVLADVMDLMEDSAEGERDLTRDIRLELSSSNRSSCQVCKEKIDKDSIRVAHPSRSSNISIMKCERLMPLSRHVGFLYVPRLRAFFVYSPAQTCTLPAT